MKKYTIIILFLLIIPKIVYTHTVWTDATPAEGDILTERPQQVSFVMVGGLNRELTTIEVFDEEGNKVSGKTQFLQTGNSTRIKVELLGGLKPGEYTVKWNFINKDKHLQPDQKGSYTFSIK